MEHADDELNAYVRSNVIKTLISVGVLVVGLGLCGFFFREQMLAVTRALHAALGALGLMGILFFSDAVFSPVPPDLVLVVIANSDLAMQWLWLILVIGLLSALGGNVGWLIAKHLSGMPQFNATFERLRAQHEDKVKRFGRWAIALGALTPVPFSITCWTAGALGMPLSQVAPLTLLRIPRFYFFYSVIAFTDNVSQLLS